MRIPERDVTRLEAVGVHKFHLLYVTFLGLVTNMVNKFTPLVEPESPLPCSQDRTAGTCS